MKQKVLGFSLTVLATFFQHVGITPHANNLLANDQAIVEFVGEAGDWHGFEKYQVEVDGKNVTVVAPERAAAGRPWVWHGEFFGHKPAPDIELLKRGFHLVYMSIPNMLGSPQAVEHWNECYKVMTEKYQFAPKVALVGLSRGGLYCYNWAAANPEKVACIYGDAPVCDFKSWPGGLGAGKGSESNWKLVLKLWGFKSQQAAIDYQGNPVDTLKPLAEAGVPLLHVFGDADDVVPWDENTGLIETRYKQLGGTIQLIRKPGVGHHPHGLEDSRPIVEFIEKHATPPAVKIISSKEGMRTYELNSPYQADNTKLHVILPEFLPHDQPERVLFLLPVEAKDGTRWGSPLAEAAQQGIADKYRVVLVYPTFSDLPWYADHPDQKTLHQEEYFMQDVLKTLKWHVPESRHDRDGRYLLGFSKSGWGAWSLLLRHPEKFAGAAAWDAPLMMDASGKYGSGEIFGTQENFQEYKLTRLLKKSAEAEGPDLCLVHAGYGGFRSHHERMNVLLKELEISGIYIDGPERKHHWQSGWLPEVADALLQSE